MVTGTDMARLAALERTTQALAMRLEALETAAPGELDVTRRDPRVTESRIDAAPVTRAPDEAAVTQAPSPPPPPSLAVPKPGGVAPAPRNAQLALEDLLGGRVLAWAGGLAILVGVVFLLAIAVSHGWLGKEARTLLAGAMSLTMLAAGVWLHERRRRSDAAVATAAAGIAALFVTIAVGGPVYGVLPTGVAHALGLAAGAFGAALAVRWQARAVGALGIVGALLAPVLAGAPADGSTLGLLWLAGLSGVAVVIWQRWDWLAVAVFAVTLAQWLWWLQGPASDAASLLVLTAFGALNVAAAIGFELRVPTASLRPSSALLLTLNAIVLALAGYQALDSSTVAQLWLGALAAAHLAVGLASRQTQIARDIRLLALALGVVLADITAASVLHGTLLTAAWAATSAAFAVLARHVLANRDSVKDEYLLALGLGGHLLLTTSQALIQAPPDTLAADQPIALGAQLAIATTASAAFAAARFTGSLRPEWRMVLDALAMSSVAYLTALTLDGPALTAALAAQALALVTIGARNHDDVATLGGLSFLGLAIAHGLAFEAPPAALVAGLQSIPAAALALGAAAATALRAAQLLPRARTALVAVTMLTLLHLVSAALVTIVPGDLGQALMSGLWATAGLTALAAGLVRDDRTLRLASLGLLLATIAKVFLYDLAALQSLYRVGSFIALGVLLLLAAGLWQRSRPRPLPDLRTTPPALR